MIEPRATLNEPPVMEGGVLGDAHLRKMIKSNVWRLCEWTPVCLDNEAFNASGLLVLTDKANKPTPNPPRDMGPPLAGNVVFALRTGLSDKRHMDPFKLKDVS